VVAARDMPTRGTDTLTAHVALAARRAERLEADRLLSGMPHFAAEDSPRDLRSGLRSNLLSNRQYPPRKLVLSSEIAAAIAAAVKAKPSTSPTVRPGANLRVQTCAISSVGTRT
jgi:hypothetical protein